MHTILYPSEIRLISFKLVGHIFAKQCFFSFDSPESDNNQKILETMKKELKKQNGGESCAWTDIQIEGKKCILST